MFKKAKYRKLDDYKKSIQQDMIVFINTVHDEIDYLVDDYLLKALLKKLTEISTLKKTINKLGIPYLNFLFDIEYDKYNSWTSSTALDIYRVTRNQAEYDSLKKYQAIKEGKEDEVIKEDIDEIEEIEEIILDEDSVDIEKLVEAIDSSVLKGDVRLGIRINGNEIMYYKNLVNKKLITKFL